MIVTITRDNILYAKPGDTKLCVIACAFKEAGLQGVAIDYETSEFNGKEYYNSKIMQTMVEEFDKLESIRDLQNHAEALNSYADKYAGTTIDIEALEERVWEDYDDYDDY